MTLTLTLVSICFFGLARVWYSIFLILTFIHLPGVFTYLSYRDPNLLKTLDIYDGTADFLRKLEMDDDTLAKSIIGTIGDVDSYQLPDAKGYSRSHTARSHLFEVALFGLSSVLISPILMNTDWTVCVMHQKVVNGE